jgi:hypothetical protein
MGPRTPYFVILPSVTYPAKGYGWQTRKYSSSLFI